MDRILYTQTQVADLARNIRKLVKLYKECDYNRNIRIHLEGTANALDKMLVKKNRDFNEKLIRKKLSSSGIKTDKISFVHMFNGRMKVMVEAYTKSGCIKTQKMAELIGEIIGIELVAGKDGRSLISQNKAEYILDEQTCYMEMHGSAVLSKKNGDVSGDSYTFETDEAGNVLMAVADGMGTGVMASKKSVMVIELIEGLSENGYAATDIPEMINAAIVEGEEDNPVTIDIAEVDLNTGIGRIVKMGGASTFILKNGKVSVLKPSSLPAGVLEDIEADIWEEQFDDGEYIIMVSDGVVDCLPFYDKEKQLAEIIEGMKHRNPQKMADYILGECKYFCGSENMDDMTVLVMGVWKTKDLQSSK